MVPHVSTETFTEVMATNALSPLRVLEALQELVPVVVAACVAVVVPSAQMSRSTWLARPSGVAQVPAVLDAHGIGPREKVLFIGVRPSNFRPYRAGRGTTELDRGPFAAVVEGKDPRELDSAETLHDLISERPDRFRSSPAGNLVVWIPDEDVHANKGVLQVE